MTILRTRRVFKTFQQGGEDLQVLRGIDFKVEPGEIVALVGQSGSGKSTFLQIAGLLDKPSEGSIQFEGEETATLNDRKRTALRKGKIGFVYQFHYLQPEFTALENVMLPQMIAGVRKGRAREKAQSMLTGLGLGHRLEHRPNRLSGGEQQRVAIARSLANDPMLLLADEPTGNLDPETSDAVFDLLLNQVRGRDIGAVIATHNLDLADQMDRIVELKNGRLLPL